MNIYILKNEHMYDSIVFQSMTISLKSYKKYSIEKKKKKKKVTSSNLFYRPYKSNKPKKEGIAWNT